MTEGNNLKLMNSEGKLMRTQLPELKLGEGVENINPFISKEALESLDHFYEELRKEGSTEKNIQDKFRSTLTILCYVANMDLKNAKREDCKNINAWINNSNYGYYRRENLRVALKKIFRFWKKTGKNNPKEVWDVIRPKNDKKPKPKKPKKLIRTNEEVDEIIKNLGNNRDKFYVALLWNTAGRPTEIETCKFKQIYELNDNLIIDLNTAKESGDEGDRKIILVYALPYYHRWKAEYKERFGIKNDDDLNEMFIFRKFTDNDKLKKIDKNMPLCHGYFSKLFTELANKLHLSDFTPKIFRKYSISRWERLGVPYALIKKMSGHAKNSQAIEHYSFHDETDGYSQLLRIEGVEERKNVIKEVSPIIKCKRCNKENKSKNETCEFCGFPLTEEMIIREQIKREGELEKLKKAMKEELENMYVQLIKEKLKS